MKTDTELRELDAWIAEHLFNLRRHTTKSVSRGWECTNCGAFFKSGLWAQWEVDRLWCGGNSVVKICPEYTTDHGAAMQVLEKCGQKYGAIRLMAATKTEWHIQSLWDGNPQVFAIGDSLPLAICLFARELFKEETK